MSDSATIGLKPAAEHTKRGEPPCYPFRAIQTSAHRRFESFTGATPELVAVVAPVGYGKTILLGDLHGRLEARGERCFWTMLDERDSRLEDLLQRCETLAAQNSPRAHPTQALFRGDQPIEARIDALVDTVSRYPHPFTAFIDNLHFCQDPRAGTLLNRLVFDTPPSAKFVLSGTVALPINLTRAKLEGRVLQIGYSELALDMTGICEMLGQSLCSQLDEAQIDRIKLLTEGWPAAVRMLQIAMAGMANPATLIDQFSGSDEDLVAMLNRQVLQGLPGNLREFLLNIAPLHDFDASLCAALTDTSDAEANAMIEDLVMRNVLIMPLDRTRTQFRLHGLFRQYLLGEARRQLGETTRLLALSRAAKHCRDHGNPRDAIGYAIEARAFDIASSTLDQHATYFVRDLGDIAQFIDWTRSIQNQGQTLGWESEYWFVWGLALNQRYDEARHQLERLGRRIDRARSSRSVGGLPADFERRLDIIRMCIDVFTDTLADADAKARQWLEQSGADDPFDITVARCICSIHASSQYRFRSARESAQSARASCTQTGSHYARAWVTALSNLPLILEGQYPIAYAAILSELEQLGPLLGEHSGILGTLSLLAGHCAIEMDLSEDAEQLLDKGLRTAHVHGYIDAVAIGLDAALKRDTGARNPADIRTQEAIDRIVAAYPPRLAYLTGCHRVRRWLRLGHLDAAEREARSLGLSAEPHPTVPPWAVGPGTRDVVSVTRLSLDIARGRGASVKDVLAQEIKRAQREARTAREVDLLLLATLVEVADSKPSRATRHLTRAIRLAAPLKLIRPFQDMSGELARFIGDTKPSAWAFVLETERQFFGEICKRLPITRPDVQEQLVSHYLSPQLLAPLTSRQAELLKLVDAGLSNQQIADRIDRQLMTVKNHLRALYSKLGVSNRAAALARARAMGIL